MAFGGFGNPQVSYNPNTALQQPLLMPQPPAYQVSVTTAASGLGYSHHGSHHISNGHHSYNYDTHHGGGHHEIKMGEHDLHHCCKVVCGFVVLFFFVVFVGVANSR